MKNRTTIKTRREPSTKNVLFSLFFCALSIAVGIIVSYYGTGESFVETGLLTAIITLFGFGLTATVFVYQAFGKNEKAEENAVLLALTKTLKLTLILISVSISLDFLGDVIPVKPEAHPAAFNLRTICNIGKTASQIYALICQFDIINSFSIIVCNKKKINNDRKN